MRIARWSREDAEALGKLLLRLLVGGLMLFHGMDKLRHGVSGVAEDLRRVSVPSWLAYGVYIGELAAPILIIVGLYTRPAGLVYAATILFATLLVHASDYLRLAETGGWAAELHVFYVLGALVVSLLGAGHYSVRRGRPLLD